MVFECELAVKLHPKDGGEARSNVNGNPIQDHGGHHREDLRLWIC